MKYTVKVADTSYDVEVEDVHARPIIAIVNGERFEVHPETEIKPDGLKPVQDVTVGEFPKPSTTQIGNSQEMTAPLPGTVVEVFVKPGEHVEIGKIVLVIEAMKMKNSIRSTRAGTVAEVLVSVGQTVSHKQALVRFEK